MDSDLERDVINGPAIKHQTLASFARQDSEDTCPYAGRGDRRRSGHHALKASWKQEKDLIARTRTLKEKIEQLKIEEQAEERKGNLQRVAEIRYGLLVQAEEELQKLTAQIDGTSQGKAAGEGARPTRMLKEEVDEEDVARIVSKWTGIPVSKMLEGEVKKLVTMLRPGLTLSAQERWKLAGCETDYRATGSSCFAHLAIAR